MNKLLLNLFIFLSLNSFAQQYSFISYGVKQGLAQSQVTDLCQDNLGYLWVGTQSGLSRFDGKKFVNYSIDNGLADNTIYKLLFSKKDNILWIATPKGITKYKNKSFKSYYFDNKTKINDLIIHKNSLFIATSKGLIVFKNNSFSNYSKSINVRQLLKKNNETIYCASNKGLYYFKNSKFILVQDSAISNLNYSGIAYSKNKQSLVISTYGNGLIKYNLKTNLKTNFSLKYKDARGVYIFDNEIWTMGNFGLIQIKSEKDITYFSEKNGLPINSIKRIYKDNESNIWIATYGKGLLKFSGKSIQSYTEKDGLASDIIMSIDNDENEFIFGTYDKGVTKYKQNVFTTFTSKNGLNYNDIWSVYYDKNNVCWIGSTRGVNYFKNNKIYTLNEIEGKIRTICEDEQSSKIYFGGKAGLWLKHNNEITHVLNDKKYDINKIIINKNKLYIATKNGVFWQALSNINEPFNQIKLKEDNCNTIVIDSYENLWIGTINGLFVLSPDNNLIEVYLDVTNFKSKNILGLLKDVNDGVWLSTADGIYLLEKTNPFNEITNFIHYSDAQGVVDLESNLNAIYEDNEGNIWIGTSSALLKINPKLNSKLFQQTKPKLSIQTIKLFKESFNYKKYAKIFNKETLVPTKLKLPHNKNHLTFEFTGINLKNPNGVKYSYRLLGSENEWSPLTENNIATYSFIFPGDYEFQVKATNNGKDFTKIKSIFIIIDSPFYKRWWFVLLIILIILFIISLLFKYRIKRIQQKKDNEKLVFKNRLRELEQQSLNASMNRHFIFNSLNSIQYFINSSDKLSANRYLSSFAKLIRKNLDSSTADNFMVKLNEEIERINLYLTLEKMRFGDKFTYKVNVDSEIDEEMTIVPSMILQPFVENSIIHGVLPLENETKGKIEINIKQEYESIIFEVIDNGVGIDNSLKLKDNFSGDHQSKGMMITANRIELLRKINGDKLMIIGPFQINNPKGKAIGTKVIIKLPINE